MYFSHNLDINSLKKVPLLSWGHTTTSGRVRTTTRQTTQTPKPDFTISDAPASPMIPLLHMKV